ncbi:hypothetical protein HBB16_09540 [Pseudonocardia sp. MCCB 268]|nr:hypothetical protein [Pseudonocardia cytotoxica]
MRDVVVPPTSLPEDIVARLGVPWIEARYVQSSCARPSTTPADRGALLRHALGGRGDEFSVARPAPGAPTATPPEARGRACSQRAIVVKDEIETVTRGRITDPTPGAQPCRDHGRAGQRPTSSRGFFSEVGLGRPATRDRRLQPGSTTTSSTPSCCATTTTWSRAGLWADPHLR